MTAEKLFRPFIFVLTIVSVMSCGTSCGQLLGELRKDLDDAGADRQNAFNLNEESYTTGGSWAERGYLEREDAESERTPTVENGRNLASDRTGRSPEDSIGGEKKLYKYGARAIRDDFIDQSQEEGSLWASGGQTNYYFTKNKIRGPGDIVTMAIENDLYRDIGVEVKRTLSPREKAGEVRLVREQLRAKYLRDQNKDTITTTAAALEPVQAPSTTPVSGAGSTEVQAVQSPAPQMVILTPQELEKKVAATNLDDVDIYSTLGVKAGDTMLGEIIGRYPNGNYKIRAVKRIPYKRGPPRMVSVVGVVKSSDINEDTDTVSSGKLYEYRIEVAH